MTPEKKAGKPSAVKAAGERKREAEAARHAREARAEAKAHKGEAPAAGPAPAEASAPAPAAEGHKARGQPKLTPEQKQAMGARRSKSAARPAFRRHEWWRYKKLGGNDAPWRVPSGIHSKVRRHFK